jgi:hypothetical protein
MEQALLQGMAGTVVDVFDRERGFETSATRRM